MFLHHFTEFYDIFAPFLPLLEQKKRKPKPAVEEQFRKFPFILFFEILNKKGAFKLPPLK